MTVSKALRYYYSSVGGVLAARRPGVSLTGGAVIPPDPSVVSSGALALGSNSYTMPADAVYVSTGGNDTTGAGTFGNPYRTLAKGKSMATSGSKTVVCRGGTYRESLTTNSGSTVTFLPYSAAGLGISEQVWLDGARVATSWTNNGNGTWTTAYTLVLTRFTDAHAGPNPLRNYCDQAWIDNIALKQISSGTPNAGQFIVNQTSHTLTIGTDPTSRTLEVSDLRTAGTFSGITHFSGIGFRKYSPDAMEWLNCILTYAGNSNGSLVKDCWVQQTAMAGFNIVVHNITVQNTTVQDCGWTGITGNTCDQIGLSKVLVRRCNQGGWSAQPALAGIKLTRCDQPNINQCWVEDDANGMGIWLDAFCTNYKITNNVVKGDALTGGAKIVTGILVEISDGGFFSSVQKRGYMVGNKVTNCSDTGIWVFDSGWNKIYNNEVTGCPVSIYLWQDNRINNGGDYRTPTESPCKTLHNEVCNNHTSSGIGYDIQFLAYDDGGVVNSKGGDMIDRFAGNWLTTGQASLTQWGQTGGSRSGGTFNTQSALAGMTSAYGGPLGSKLGTNYFGTTTPSAATYAEALPADVASILGVSTGAKQIGPSADLIPVGVAAVDSTPPLAPVGYALFKEIDLTSTAGWEVREGQTKASGVMRAANVSVSSSGLNLAAGRIGGEVSSSEVRLNGVSGLALPQFCFMRTEVSFDAIVGGIWPAVWRRPFTGFHNGELDDMEKFGTTTHASMHTTDYTQSSEYATPGHRQQAGANFSGTTGGDHVIESLVTPSGYSVWWDGVFINTFTPADFDANATPIVASGGSTFWSPQFDTSTKQWQLIFSNQVNSAYGGGLPTGAYVWNFKVTRCRIWAP